MTEYSAKCDPSRCPSHPGVLLREVVIPATGRSKAEIAALLGISRQHLHDILAEKKPVSAHVAVRLGKLFGDGAGVWLRMQAAYDTWHAERELAVEVKKIPTLPAAYRRPGVMHLEEIAGDCGSRQDGPKTGTVENAAPSPAMVRLDALERLAALVDRILHPNKTVVTRSQGSRVGVSCK